MAIPLPPEKTFPVTVTNTSDKELVDYFDGKEFSFPTKKSITIPSNVARHILGYGGDKRDAVVRLGWTETSKDMPAALARLAKFKCDPPEDETRSALSPGAERVPLSSPKGSDGGKLALAPAAS